MHWSVFCTSSERRNASEQLFNAVVLCSAAYECARACSINTHVYMYVYCMRAAVLASTIVIYL